jgi:hypothetical protein
VGEEGPVSGRGPVAGGHAHGSQQPNGTGHSGGIVSHSAAASTLR